MSDDFWYFIALILAIILLGLKLTAFLLILGAIYWVLVTKDD